MAEKKTDKVDRFTFTKDQVGKGKLNAKGQKAKKAVIAGLKKSK